jgi:DNA-binding NarL/FixJ family response regulator
MIAKRVLSVGQCFADHSNLSATLQRAFDAEVVGAASASEALAKLRSEPFALVLVNRIFDADGASGIELIRALKGDTALSPMPVMLVSNYDDAQEEATTAGAMPGFGKATLGQAAMLARLAPYLKTE